jgi:hypothetical protein
MRGVIRRALLGSPDMRCRAVLAAIGVIHLLAGGAGAPVVRAQSTAWSQLPSGPPAVEAPVGLCPGDPGLVYIGTFGGGVLRSRDEGRTFQAANTGLTNLAVSAMVVDPIHCEFVYAATFGGGVRRQPANQGLPATSVWTQVPRCSTPGAAAACSRPRPAANSGSRARTAS